MKSLSESIADNERAALQAEAKRQADLVARIQNAFAFHPAAAGGDAAVKHDKVRFLLRTVAIALVDNTVPVGREQSLMLTALEEAMHWANAGIANQGPVAT